MIYDAIFELDADIFPAVLMPLALRNRLQPAIATRARTAIKTNIILFILLLPIIAL
jgi:hypothetical protein